jgi:ribosome-associated translation inhibitor RaiA
MMIELKIDGQGYELNDELNDEIHAKIGTLDEHMEALQGGHVTISWEGGPDGQTKVHAKVWGSGHSFDASDVDWSSMATVDQVGHKLATQIRREHRKDVADRRHG